MDQQHETREAINRELVTVEMDGQRYPTGGLAGAMIRWLTTNAGQVNHQHLGQLVFHWGNKKFSVEQIIKHPSSGYDDVGR